MLQCFLIAHALAGLGRDNDAVELLSATRAAAPARRERGRTRDSEDTVAWTFSIASELAADQARAS
jgi:hypothetical protein